MQFGGHHTCGYGRIGFHEFSSRRFVRCLEDRNAKCFITWFPRATGQDELTGLNRCLEIGEMPIDRRFVLCRSRFVIVQTRYKMEHVNKLLRFSCRFGSLSSQ